MPTPDIVFTRGQFQRFRATTRVHLGAIAKDIGENDEFEFDGQVVRLGGEEFTVPVIKGGIKAGWFVPVADTTSTYTPKPADLLVHPADRAVGDQTPVRMQAASAEETPVGDVKSVRQRVETQRVATAEPQPKNPAPAAQPFRHMPVEQESEAVPVRGARVLGDPTKLGNPVRDTPQPQPVRTAAPQPQAGQMPVVKGRTPFRATIAFHLGANTNRDPSDRSSLNDLMVEKDEIVEFDGMTVWVRGEEARLPTVSKAIKAGWLVPIHETQKTYVPKPGGVVVKTPLATVVAMAEQGEGATIVPTTPRAGAGSAGSDGEVAVQFGEGVVAPVKVASTATGDVDEPHEGDTLEEILPEAVSTGKPEASVHVTDDGFKWDTTERQWRQRVKEAVEKHGNDPATLDRILAVETPAVQRYIKSELARRQKPSH